MVVYKKMKPNKQLRLINEMNYTNQIIHPPPLHINNIKKNPKQKINHIKILFLQFEKEIDD